ncbi:MAG TPA: D-alanyl-D-alanine carboxypeptidase/D-alanyl-D-alanine-endopeptidase [Gemmatimonadales bacterium]|nr:D-alanyl-D-alanine carboxypeptidase/D-alanyl-D-alanine-endopeptidase [Gemmatimonadales bacterium]
MHRRLSWTLAFCALSSLTPALAAQDLTPAERLRVDDWYRKASDRTSDGEWGIAIGTMGGRVLWSVNSELELIPASTAKLFTVGFSRARAGGGARISTRIIGRGALDSTTGRWMGSWQLELGGDPTLERSGRDGPTLRELARQLRARGIIQLDGALALTSRTGPAASRYPAVWSAEFVGQLYAPPVGPVTLHENTISLTFRPGQDVGSPPTLVSAYPAGVDRLVRMSATTVGGSRRRLSLTADPDGGWTLSGTIGIASRRAGISAVAHEPASVLGYAWAAALDRAGIRWVNRSSPAIVAPGVPAVLAKVESAPFDSVAVEINRRSLNIGAELVLQWAAASQTSGPALLNQHVREVVGPNARIRLVDGSGLSELDRVSPMTQMLYLARYPQLHGAERYPLLLPANGMGTLRGLRYGMGKGVVHAKTGTLDRVATLAGYLGRPDGVLVISLMYNGRRTHAARAAEWELFRLLGAEGVNLSGALETQMGGPTNRDDETEGAAQVLR